MNRYFGDKKFYKRVLWVSVPIMLQNGITNLVGFLDNIMVGAIGDDPMSGVAIVNQLMFVFNLAIFGGLSGAGIFTAQYFGKGQHEGVRYTFRFKVITAVILLFLGYFTFLFFGGPLIEFFLHEGSETGNIELTRAYAREYLDVMLIGLIPFAISQVYSSTLRETGETVVPMIASIVAVIINLLLNLVLINGLLGFPALKVVGAAIATVISRFAEVIIIVLYTHIKHKKYVFIQKAYRSIYIPKHLCESIIKKGMPLMVNELLWASSVSVLLQCYSTRGLDAVAAVNIANTINNLFNVVFIALGCSISIIVGQMLGAGEMEKARDTDRKMIVFSVVVCLGIGLIMAATASLFPRLYNSEPLVRDMAASCIRIMAALMPFCAFTHAAYFTLRSGGKTIVTFIFDSCYMWGIVIPIAYILSRKTGLGLIALYACCQSLEIIKCFIGGILLKKGTWLQNIVKGEPAN